MTDAVERPHRAPERVARDRYGRLLAFLAARTPDLAGAEDVLADACAAALRTQPSSKAYQPIRRLAAHRGAPRAATPREGMYRSTSRTSPSGPARTGAAPSCLSTTICSPSRIPRCGVNRAVAVAAIKGVAAHSNRWTRSRPTRGCWITSRSGRFAAICSRKPVGRPKRTRR
jgi:hypothetical protein